MGSALDRLMGQGKSQHGKAFEATSKIERNTKDLNIFASHNSNEACNPMPTVAQQLDGEITIPQAIANTVNSLRGQVGILKSMSMSITDDSLSMISKAYEQVNDHAINVRDLYHSNKEYKGFLNAVASGFVVTSGIEHTIDNPIKLYFDTGLDTRAVDMNVKAGYQFKGNIPCIKAFDEDNINKVQAFVRTVASQISTAQKGVSLFDFINAQGSKFKEPIVIDNTVISEKVVLKSMDIKQLAEYLSSKFSANIDLGIQFARDNDVSEEKLQRVSMLIKAVRDYKN